MERKKVDFIIVGQGIAGSWLAYELDQRGQQVVIINHEKEATATLKAGGLYNPITGRKMVKTWKADQLFPTLEEKYQSLEVTLQASFLHATPIYRPFLSTEEKNDWHGKSTSPEYEGYLSSIKESSLEYQGIQDQSGGIVLNHSGYVDLPIFISAFRKYFSNKGMYRSEVFDYSELDTHPNEPMYKDLQATKIIYCEGPDVGNPFWNDLPFRNVRGELFDIECGIESRYIINRGVFMIPKKGYFTVGSTYDHKLLTFEPQEAGIESLKEKLSKLFTGEYRIINKRAGVRPATYDRKPFIGIHKKIKTLGIFNGFGTKGVSLTPYFAAQFADYLIGRSEIEKEVDVQRAH